MVQSVVMQRATCCPTKGIQMASKSNKKSSSGAPRSYSEVYKSSAATGAPAVQTTAATPATKSATKTASPALSGSDTVDWYGEYGYVLSDLKLLGIVTAGLLVGIIVLSFFF